MMSQQRIKKDSATIQPARANGARILSKVKTEGH
jgi:hypothetical protein